MQSSELGVLLDVHGEVALLRLALAADPNFSPALYDFIALTRYQPEVRDSMLAAGREDTPPRRCIALVARAPTGYPAAVVPALLALEAQHQASVCSKLFLGVYGTELTPLQPWSKRAVEYLEAVNHLAPEIAYLWVRRAGLLVGLQQVAAARAVLEEGLSRSVQASQRVQLYQSVAAVMARSADSLRAFELRRALAAAVERDGRPGLKNIYPEYLDFFRPPDPATPRWESQGLERVRLAGTSGDLYQEWSVQRNLGAALSDAGRPTEALPHLERAVWLAERSGSRLMQTEAYRFRGRTLAKLGKADAAERDLRHAIALAPGAEDGFYRAEAYHNLAHTLEEMGHLREAARMIDSFIAYTRPLRHAQPRMMSLRDAAIIRRKNGWPAAAHAADQEMVKVVDEQDRGHYWAGEYYEQSGDFARARDEFHRGVDEGNGELSLNLGGLARVFEKLGQLDSAEGAARAHDSVMSNQLDVPLLPPILAAAGRGSEAVRISRTWTDLQFQHGNLQGAAMAAVGLADLLLKHGDPRQALLEAERAESLAKRITSTDELIQARRIEGQSLLGLRDSAGLVRLRAAAALAKEHPTKEGELSTQLALAEGLAGTGRVDEALTAFDQSARIVEQTTRRLEVDLDRVRFRDHQVAAFDGAIDLLLAQPEGAARLAALTAWSQRRKAAALALAVGTQPANAHRPSLSIAEIRQRLPRGTALLDYLTIGQRSAVLLVTAEAAAVVALPLSPDSLTRLADRLRSPLVHSYAGQIDLTRAQFDSVAARALYAALVAPFGPRLEHIDRLLIVPDGALHYVPFDALLGQNGYLLDRFQIELLPSAQFLPAATPRPLTASVLVIAHDAPGAEQEAEAIAAAWRPGAVTVLSGNAATETAFQNAHGVSILHFAAHAEADDREPLASHLRLAPDAMNDGFLQLGEIARRQHPAQLVILSACETLSGTLYRGEGLMGLGRAFLTAGAGSVLATEWPIGSASAELMGAFHRQLAAGIEPAAALRDAKRTLRGRAATAHPFFWAGFVLLRGATGPA